MARPVADAHAGPRLVRPLRRLLIVAGTALAFHADIFPWDLGDETSVIFGFIYLGAAAYFVWGFLHPSWPNATGQLIGFLAYDLVLIGPFVDQFDDVSGGKLTSLIVYTAFVVYSAGARRLLPVRLRRDPARRRAGRCRPAGLSAGVERSARWPSSTQPCASCSPERTSSPSRR